MTTSKRNTRTKRASHVLVGATLGVASLFSLNTLAQEISDVVLLASEQIKLKPGSVVVSGNLVTNNADDSDQAEDEFIMGVNSFVSGRSDIYADTIHLLPRAVVRGSADYNQVQLDGNAKIVGEQTNPLNLPVFASLPAFEQADYGFDNVTVARGEVLQLPAGDYDVIEVQQGGKLEFTGGEYNIRSLVTKRSSVVLFSSASKVRVAETVLLARDSRLLSRGVSSAEVTFYVAGADGFSFDAGKNSIVEANIYALNGNFRLSRDSLLRGAVIARKVDIGRNSEILLNNGFSVTPQNQAPSAPDLTISVAQGEIYDSEQGINLLTSATDPDGDDGLVVTTASDVTSAGSVVISTDGSFIYRHDNSAQETDSFVYEVCDNGDPVLCDQGTVTIDVELAPENLPPVAQPQVIEVMEGETVTITLVGSDPENKDLSFSVIETPVQGSLSEIVEGLGEAPGIPEGCERESCSTQPIPARTSATVEYTAAGLIVDADTFSFQVQDDAGNTGVATVTLLPKVDEQAGGGEEPLANLAVSDLSAEVSDVGETTLGLSADVPEGIDVVYSIISAATNGVLADIVPAEGSPVTTATVVYTPNPDITAPLSDSFVFEACAVIAEVTECGQATYSLDIYQTNQVIADSQTILTPSDVTLDITLTAFANTVVNSSDEPSATDIQLTIPASVAGAVASSSGLVFFGDNVTDLSNDSPLLVSAAADSEGEEGLNGLVRTHMEFEIADLAGIQQYVKQAQVVLTTQRGESDSLPTTFWVGLTSTLTGPDGALTIQDFLPDTELLAGAEMPVPDVAIGTVGTYTLDVTESVKASLAVEYSFWQVQGRLADEAIHTGDTANYQSGLQVYSTAESNIAAYLEPVLTVTVADNTPILRYTITSLPSAGTLLDGFGNVINTVPAVLPNSDLNYIPGSESGASYVIGFEASNGSAVDTGTITVWIDTVNEPGDCEVDPLYCGGGRD